MTQTSPHHRIHSLDFLRSIAILLVMCWHLPKVDGRPALGFVSAYGLWGVDLFFVLSGYLIGHQLFRSLQTEGRLRFRDFYLRRATRTWPAYFVVLTLYLIFPLLRENPEMPPAWRFLTFTQNFGLTFSAFSHAWSLCIEEQFYLLFPIVAVLLWRRKNPTFAIGLVLLILMGGMALRGSLWFTMVKDALQPERAYFSQIYYPTWGRLDGLVFGVSIAATKNFLTPMWTRWMRHGNGFLVLGLVILVAGFWLHSPRLSFAASVFGFPVVSLGFALIVLAALSPTSVLQKFKVPGAGMIATLSYSLYLLHKQIFHFISQLFPGMDVFSLSALSFAGSFAAAAVLYCLVERPGLILRDRWTARTADCKFKQSGF